MRAREDLAAPLAWLGLLALLVAVWFGTLGFRPLAKTDEGRYAEIPREMLVTGNWLTPRLDGLKYFEKPALQYWATAIAYRIGGINTTSARFWPAFTGLVGVLAVAWTATRLYGRRAGLAAGLVLASMTLYFFMAHMLTLDMGLTAFMTLGLCGALVAGSAQGRTGRAWMWVAWASFGCAVLSKGLEGIVLPGAVLVLYLGISRDWAFLRQLEWVRGGTLFAVVALPWFVAVSLANPGFAHFFFIHEHFERYLTTSHHREAPWWYFLPILAAGVLPWLALVPEALARPPAPLPPCRAGFRPGLLLGLWCGFILVFFSASDSKLASYVLPILPALALLVGAHLAAQKRPLFLAIVSAGVVGVIFIAAGASAEHFLPLADQPYQDAHRAYRRLGHFVAVGGFVTVLGALLAGLMYRRAQPLFAMATLAMASILGEATGLVGYSALAGSTSGLYVAHAIESSVHPDTHLYSVQTYDQTLPFYLGRTFTLVDERDELDFGLSAEPGLGIATLAAFKTVWTAERDALAIMPPGTFVTLQAMQLPMRVLLSDRRYVVVSRS